MPEDQRESLREEISPEEVAWLHFAEGAFAADWDNEQDALYDNWRQIYGVRQKTERI
jgi:hypothetical protein